MALPELISDAIAEILLRLPPDEPACLVRASLVCKPWRRLLSDTVFLRRYREFHRTPPLLGFVRNLYEKSSRSRFVPTSAASPFSALVRDDFNLWVLECRHGRVLLDAYYNGHKESGVVVCDPITGIQQFVRNPSCPPYLYYIAAVICSIDGCDHLDCHGGPFRVVFLGFLQPYDEEDQENMGRLCVSMYSSEVGAVTTPSTIQCGGYVEQRPSVHSGDALYFNLDKGKRLVKYDLIENGLSVIDAPDVDKQGGIAITREDGGLGFAGVKDDSLYLWSWQVGSGWLQDRIIKLKTLLPVLQFSESFDVIGFAEGTDIIFLNTDGGVFTINLKSGQVRKVAERVSYNVVAPYTSFYTSDLATGSLLLP